MFLLGSLQLFSFLFMQCQQRNRLASPFFISSFRKDYLFNIKPSSEWLQLLNGQGRQSLLKTPPVAGCPFLPPPLTTFAPCPHFLSTTLWSSMSPTILLSLGFQRSFKGQGNDLKQANTMPLVSTDMEMRARKTSLAHFTTPT